MFAWLTGFKGWLYAGAVAAIVGAFVWLRFHWVDVGYEKAASQYESRLTESRAQAQAIEDSYADIERNHARELSATQADRDAAYAHARARLQPVVLRTRACPTVPELADTARSADQGDAQAELPVRVGEGDQAAGDMPDIGPVSLAIMKQCQEDNDEAVRWDRWWAEVSAVR